MSEFPVLSQNLTMSSREIATLTGKRHDNVKRTIETCAESGAITLPQIEEVPNEGLGPKTVSVYKLDKRSSLIVVAQLSPEFTARIIDRWQELEQKLEQPAPQPQPVVYNDTPAEVAIRVASLLCRELELHGAVKVSMLKSALLLKAPEYVVLLPAYGQNAPRTADGKLVGGETSTKPAFAASALLKKFKSPLTIHKFNKLVEEAGYLEVRERPSSKYEGVVRTYKAVSDKGLRFGMNLAPADRPQNIQPLWFEHTFEDLLMSLA